MSEMLIHRVTGGPYTKVDGLVWCTCMIEEEGQLFYEDLPFRSLDEAYRMVTHFKTSIDHIPLKFDQSGYVAMKELEIKIVGEN